MPKPTFSNLPAEKRARIVEHAIDEFAMHPYAQASLSRIVARAGIAKGSVYQYFEHKLDLYQWLLFEEVGRRKLAYGGAASNEGTLFDRLTSQCGVALAFFRAEPRLARLASRLFEPEADPELRPLHDETRRRGRAFLLDELKRAKRAGEVRADVDLELGATVLSHVLGAALTDAVLVALGVDLGTLLADPERGAALSQAKLDRIVRGVIDIVRHGLGAEAALGPEGRPRRAPKKA